MASITPQLRKLTEALLKTGRSTLCQKRRILRDD